jgi:CheY-like chemotaxis protein
LSNAIKFTPAGGRVQVVLHRVASHVEIVVTDTGEGIRPEFLPHVFERFRQADASSSRKHAGLGVGLAIVKHLVEMHGGSVEVASEGEGRGSTFTVRLPVMALRDTGDGAEPAGRPAPLPGTPTLLAGVKVLVVDNEADARDLIRRVLEECDAEVALAESANHALTLIDSWHPDVLISDIAMPDKDGYQFLHEVRGRPNEAGKKLPAVALTAFARSEDRTRAMLAGYQVHMAKPVESNELIATVASLAGRTGQPEAVVGTSKADP